MLTVDSLIVIAASSKGKGGNNKYVHVRIYTYTVCTVYIMEMYISLSN